MADKHPKSKLKRKKSAVIEINQADLYQRDSLQKLNKTLSSPVPLKDALTDSSKANRGTVSPNLTWWTRNDLNVSEKLWANTMEAALPFLGSELWDPLPEPFTVTPRQSKQQRHVPDNEVPAFPEPSRPTGTPLQSPPRPICVFSPENLIDQSPHTGPVVTPARGCRGGGPRVPESTTASWSASPPPTQEDSGPAPTRKEVVPVQGAFAEKTLQSQDLTERPVRPFPLWSGTSPRAKEIPLCLPTQADAWTSSGVRGSRVQAAEVEERVLAMVEHEAVEEAGPSGAQRKDGGEADGREEVGPGEVEPGGGGERLLCCPMCTLVFPSRFSQMDCDSHLAQCLSEMNVDMAW